MIEGAFKRPSVIITAHRLANIRVKLIPTKAPRQHTHSFFLLPGLISLCVRYYMISVVTLWSRPALMLSPGQGPLWQQARRQGKNRSMPPAMSLGAMSLLVATNLRILHDKQSHMRGQRRFVAATLFRLCLRVWHLWRGANLAPAAALPSHVGLADATPHPYPARAMAAGAGCGCAHR